MNSFSDLHVDLSKTFIGLKNLPFGSAPATQLKQSTCVEYLGDILEDSMHFNDKDTISILHNLGNLGRVTSDESSD